MTSRHPNHRLVKIHRTYTVEEVAETLNVHKNTVRSWLKIGLETIDKRRPAMIQGAVLSTFLQRRRARMKKPCRPGEAYCLRCRLPRRFSPDSAQYIPMTEGRGQLVGHCCDCGTRLFRRGSVAKLPEAIAICRSRYRKPTNT